MRDRRFNASLAYRLDDLALFGFEKLGSAEFGRNSWLAQGEKQQ
jgi:hypothetical protein